MHYDHKNVDFARNLRKNMTPWERKLWYCFLKSYPVRFQRQKVIGSFIADFYCAKAHLVVELDGSGHYTPEAKKQDNVRTDIMQLQGIQVIRFCNLDIDRDFQGVCNAIDMAVTQRTPSGQANA